MNDNGLCRMRSFVTKIDEPVTTYAKDGSEIVSRRLWLLSKEQSQFQDEKSTCVTFYKGKTDKTAWLDALQVGDIVDVSFHVTSKIREWTDKKGETHNDVGHWLSGVKVDLIDHGTVTDSPKAVSISQAEEQSAQAQPPAKADESIWDDDVPF